MAIEKLEKDGQVAVLYSPGFGAGWSTWNDGVECIFDPDIAKAVLTGNAEEVISVAIQKYPDHFHGGVDCLRVEWVPKGARFEIREYDGAESVHVFGPDDGLAA